MCRTRILAKESLVPHDAGSYFVYCYAQGTVRAGPISAKENVAADNNLARAAAICDTLARPGPALRAQSARSAPHVGHRNRPVIVLFKFITGF